MKSFIYFFTFVFFISSLVSCSSYWSQSFEERKFHKLLNQFFKDHLSAHPEIQTSLGYKKGKSQWDNLSQKQLEKENKKTQEYLMQLSTFILDSFSKENQLSWSIFESLLKRNKEEFKFRFHPYLVDQLFGHHTYVNSFLINIHTIRSVQDAQDYIARVQGLSQNFDQLIERLRLSAEQKIVPPLFVFSKVEEVLINLLKGAPFDLNGKHILLEDFNKKIKILNLSSHKKEKLNAQLKNALIRHYKPAYQRLLNEWRNLREQSRPLVGVWSQPLGDEYYAMKLRHITTTNNTPEEVYQLGLKEVQRIHLEIQQLKNKIGFKGSLLDFFNDFRNNKEFYYTNKSNYITDARQSFFEARKLLPKYFGLLPQRPLIIKEVEKFRAKSTGSAFYERPSIRGDRPGVFYINLYNMNEQPQYSLKALTFHETTPGHHLQISIALDLKSIPHFRRHMNVTAYTEGWALYAEKLADEMGLYKNEYDQFGRLSMELMRACRLVVDTGLHYKKWSRWQAIEYLIKNSDVSYESAARSVDRYIVYPAQATAYMIGYLKILELRKIAKEKLKNSFDIKEFHDQILKNGAVPLDILEQVVQDWIKNSYQQVLD